MNYKFYLFATIGFLLLPVILSIAMVLPYVLPDYGFIYYSVKPYAQQIFSDKQTVWTYTGILSAGTGIFLGFVYKDFTNKEKTRRAIYALYQEILRNIDLIFSGEVERPYSFTAFERVNQEYVDYIKNPDKFVPIRRIYDELYYYREIVKVWRPTNPGNIVTEKQFTACNVALEYLEGEGINPNPKPTLNAKVPGNNKWEKLRTLAIERKLRNIELWKVKLRLNIKQIFGIEIN